MAAIFYKKKKIKAGRSILSRACQKLNLRRKKLSKYASEQEREEIKKKRQTYCKEIAKIPIGDLIFLDESGANLQMAPLYGRAYKKERVRYSVPLNRGSRLTLISAISFQKVQAALYGEWCTNGEIFLNFIEQYLCPVLRSGHVVVMDNVAFHQVAWVKEAVEKTGACLVYLPPYSPQLNPIEQMWGKIKHYLRKASAQTLNDFKKSVKIAFESIESADLGNWFKHCGYMDLYFRELL